MKYIKMLGLAAVAATALTAILGAGSASATTLTKEGGAIMGANSTIHANLESGTVAKLIFGFETVECNEATIGAITANETGAEITANMTTKTLFFNKCDCEVKTLAGNFLLIKSLGNNNGTLTSSGAEITVNCTSAFGLVHCIISTASTDIGTLTGSANTKATATMDIASANIGLLKTNPICGETAKWEGKYLVGTPDTLNVIN